MIFFISLDYKHTIGLSKPKNTKCRLLKRMIPKENKNKSKNEAITFYAQQKNDKKEKYIFARMNNVIKK